MFFENARNACTLPANLFNQFNRHFFLNFSLNSQLKYIKTGKNITITFCLQNNDINASASGVHQADHKIIKIKNNI